jgi:toxin FitB
VTGWLLDTNVLSELRKARPERRVISFIASRPLDDLFVSTVSFSEIRFGIERAPDAVRRASLHDWLTHRLRPTFAGRILPISEDVMFTWRLLVEVGRRSGRTFAQPDLIIAATALCHGLRLVSRNAGDFAGTDVTLFNPWTDAMPRGR